MGFAGDAGSTPVWTLGDVFALASIRCGGIEVFSLSHISYLGFLESI